MLCIVYTFVCFIAIVLIVVSACITTGQTVVVRRIQCECACDLENHWMKLFDFKVWALFSLLSLTQCVLLKMPRFRRRNLINGTGVVDLNIARKKTHICRYGLSFEKSTCFQCEIMIFMKNESLSVVNDQVWTNKTRCLMQTNERNKNRRQIR